MPAPFVVNKLCQAEETLDELENSLIRARIDVSSLRDIHCDDNAELDQEFVSVYTELEGLVKEVDAVRAKLGPAIKHAAALIPDPEPQQD